MYVVIAIARIPLKKNLSFFIIFTLIFSKSIDSLDYKILNFTYNHEFQKAEILIAKAIKDYPLSPKYHFYHFAKELNKMDYLVDQTILDKKKQIRDSVLSNSLKSSEAFLEKIDTDTLSLINKYYVAAIYGFMGRYIADESYFKAFKYGKKGRNLLEEVIEEKPDFYDAYLGLGMFNYYADRLSGFIGFISSILGFSGDRNLGLEYMKLAANKGKESVREANFVLGDIYLNMEADFNKALPYLKRFAELCPKNKFAQNRYVFTLMNMNEHGLIQKEYEEKNRMDLLSQKTNIEYYYQVGNFEKSKELCKKFIQRQNRLKHSRVNNIKYRLAVLNYLTNKEEVSDSILLKIDKGYLDHFNNLKTDTLYHMVISFMIQINTKTYNSHFKKMLDSNHKFKSKLLRENYLYFKASYYFREKNYLKAKDVLDNEFKYRKHFKANLLLTLFEISDKPEEFAFNNLEDLIDDNDYEHLEFRLEDLEDKFSY